MPECHIDRSSARARTSTVVVPGSQTAAAPPPHWPPWSCQFVQEVPFQPFLYIAESWPSTNTSIFPTPQEATAGEDAMTPPSPCHGAHVVPFQERCHKALSCPRT